MRCPTACCNDHMATCTRCGRPFDTRASSYENTSRCAPCWDAINSKVSRA